MIDIEVSKILKEYNGNNTYILFLKNKNGSLTQTQKEYIINNHNYEVKIINKIIEITNFFGEQLKEKFELKNIPQRIFVEKVIGETEKAFHVVGKPHKNSKDEFIWIPKSQLSEDLFWVEPEVNIDWSKYSNRMPFSYQQEGIKELLKHDKYILAFSMGLGKSLSAVIGALESGAERILIVCPASLKYNWKKEILFYDKEENIHIVSAKTGWGVKKFTIINYDVLDKYHNLKNKELSRILDAEFDLLIADEAHYIKNKSAIRTKIFNDIAKNIKKVWLLTGTPMTNRPSDFYNLLKICEHPVAHDWNQYVRNYCNAKQMRIKGRIIWNTNGASNLDELHRRIKNIMLRRKKEDVLDLPKKMIIPIYLELDNRKEYEEAIVKYIEWRRTQGVNINPNNKLVQLSVLRKFIALEKIDHTFELIEKCLEENKKCIVFTNYNAVLDELEKRLKNKCVRLDGSVEAKERQRLVDEFQTNDEIKVFISNIIAGGTGITLTKAQTTIFNDLHFTPAIHAQSEDRNHRIGVEHDVTIYYPLFDNSVDSIVYNILDKKKKVIDQAIEGITPNEEQSSVLTEIIDAIENNFNI